LFLLRQASANYVKLCASFDLVAEEPIQKQVEAAIHLHEVTRCEACIVSEGIRLRDNKQALKTHIVAELKRAAASKTPVAQTDVLPQIWRRAQDASRFKDR
jgi:hypothetical protein